MSLHICPHCKERFSVGFGVTDYVHECNSGNKAIDQEDVVVMGNWEDYSGSGVKAPQDVLRQGMINELQGKDVQIDEGKDKERKTRRGERASTRRQRQRETFINLSKGGLD